MLFATGILLALFGSFISIGFWMPGVVNQGKIKEVLGSRYAVMYVIYIANGPLLALLGFYLIALFH